MKNVKIWKLEDLFAKFNKKMWKVGNCGHICKKIEKKGFIWKNGENTKNEKFEDQFALVMKIFRKILKVKV